MYSLVYIIVTVSKKRNTNSGCFHFTQELKRTGKYISTCPYTALFNQDELGFYSCDLIYWEFSSFFLLSPKCICFTYVMCTNEMLYMSLRVCVFVCVDKHRPHWLPRGPLDGHKHKDTLITSLNVCEGEASSQSGHASMCTRWGRELLSLKGKRQSGPWQLRSVAVPNSPLAHC